MTDDLVRRLRRWTHAVDAAPASDLMDEAADEIERLGAALAAYTAGILAEAESKEPVAWALLYPNGEVAVIAFKRSDAEERASASDRIVPLYRSPTLAPEEREAVWTVAEAYAENDGDPECEQIARIMQGLWQRTK